MLQCMKVMKTRGSSKLSTSERKRLILDLCRSLSVLSSSEEVAEALSDLLTPKEIETIAKRLKIAEYLSLGKQYNFIRDELKVGYSTISRINTWLNLSGEGFKKMITKRKKSPKKSLLEEKYDPFSWYNIKRRYSLNFWPQLLLEEIIKSSDRKEKNKITKIIKKLDLKKERFNSDKNKKLFESFESQL